MGNGRARVCEREFPPLLLCPVAKQTGSEDKRCCLFPLFPPPPVRWHVRQPLSRSVRIFSHFVPRLRHILQIIKFAKKTQFELHTSQSSTRYRKVTKGSVKNSCWRHRERNLAPLLSLWFPRKKKNPQSRQKKVREFEGRATPLCRSSAPASSSAAFHHPTGGKLSSLPSRGQSKGGGAGGGRGTLTPSLGGHIAESRKEEEEEEEEGPNRLRSSSSSLSPGRRTQRTEEKGNTQKSYLLLLLCLLRSSFGPFSQRRGAHGRGTHIDTAREKGETKVTRKQEGFSSFFDRNVRIPSLLRVVTQVGGRRGEERAQ